MDEVSTRDPAVGAVGTFVCWGPTMADDHAAADPDPPGVGPINEGGIVGTLAS